MLCGLCAQFEPIDEVAFTYTYTDHWYRSIRVPVVLLGPGFWGGGRVEQLVSLLDIPPTLIEAAGLPVPDELHGRSVLQLLNGEREGWPGEVFVEISESQVGRAIRPEAHPKGDPTAERYVEDVLYDLEADPYELHNLAGRTDMLPKP